MLAALQPTAALGWNVLIHSPVLRPTCSHLQLNNRFAFFSNYYVGTGSQKPPSVEGGKTTSPRRDFHWRWCWCWRTRTGRVNTNCFTIALQFMLISDLLCILCVFGSTLRCCGFHPYQQEASSPSAHIMSKTIEVGIEPAWMPPAGFNSLFFHCFRALEI